MRVEIDNIIDKADTRLGRVGRFESFHSCEGDDGLSTASTEVGSRTMSPTNSDPSSLGNHDETHINQILKPFHLVNQVRKWVESSRVCCGARDGKGGGINM